ncbi:MAG: single-stranded-DNA-specific exonuclease RecJ [Nitrospirae bacterium]|nr:single-stranded-DNA-specific exonuclease RecJ [Nitrospirota bacterium]
MNRHWLVKRTNPEFLKYLSDKLSISATVAQILVNRGIKEPDSIKDFLYPSLNNLCDPLLMPDMKDAVERIKTAINRSETVFVHGDYDADGVTSTALLVSALRRLGLKTFYHIPNRFTEGYGVSSKGIGKARLCGAGLIITVDCGISSGVEIASARSIGIDVIVTDHHEPPEQLPEATAVINPRRADSEYPFKCLAGVGVAFKLVQALFQSMEQRGEKADLNEYLDLVALGTVADSVALTGENRILAAYGLKEINSEKCRAGIKALRDSANIEGELRAGQLSYTLIPRINAAGRVDDAGVVVELLLTQDNGEAKRIADILEEQNRERQKIGEKVFRSALNMVDPDNPGNAIVLSSAEWHPGVIGIVASRLVELFYRPVFLFSVKDSMAKGSARSIPPFHLYNGVAECADILIAFGGHGQAAGIKILSENLPVFRERISLIAEKSLSGDEITPVLNIDASVELSDIKIDLVKELSLLEPYGEANREPLLGAKSVKMMDYRVVGNGHLKMRALQNNSGIDTIGFGKGDIMKKISMTAAADIAFVPCMNEWNGIKSLQLNLKAIRPSAENS